MKTICDMRPGDIGKIVKIHGCGPLKRRFNDMGMIKGSVLEFVKVAPLGDPIQVKIKDTNLTLRCENAAQIEIE